MSTNMTAAQRQAHIQALLTEREGYERAGNDERVAQVDEQLRVYGHEAQTPAKRAERR